MKEVEMNEVVVSTVEKVAEEAWEIMNQEVNWPLKAYASQLLIHPL